MLGTLTFTVEKLLKFQHIEGAKQKKFAILHPQLEHCGCSAPTGDCPWGAGAGFIKIHGAPKLNNYLVVI